MKEYIQWRPITEFSAEQLAPGDRILGVVKEDGQSCPWDSGLWLQEVEFHDGEFWEAGFVGELAQPPAYFALFRCDP